MKKYFLTGVLALLAVMQAYAQDAVSKTTEVYALKGSDTLRLDRYWVSGCAQPMPCVLFLFGGGFFSGVRDRDMYIPYFEYLARKGLQVVSIDYRLGFKGLKWPTEEKKPSKRELIDYFEHQVVDVAVEDLFDATAYVVAHAGTWGIDPAKIIGNGSSAGAVTVLQGAYYIANGNPMIDRLPENFDYAGIIAFAGAIFSRNGLKWKSVPAPLLLFHGDADANVPYNKMSIFGIGLFGSKNIAKKLDRLGDAPYWFYALENTDHEVACTPMDENREEILSFLRNYVEGERSLVIRTKVNPLDKPDAKNSFRIKDYIRKNFQSD